MVKINLGTLVKVLQWHFQQQKLTKLFDELGEDARVALDETPVSGGIGHPAQVLLNIEKTSKNFRKRFERKVLKDLQGEILLLIPAKSNQGKN